MRRSQPMQAAVWCALSLSPCAGADVIYVNHAACGANTGTGWADAFLDLHDALAAAQAGDEIWVAAGRYTPDRGSGDREMSFVLDEQMSIYGGFAGTETAHDQRDWSRYPTILQGDLAGNDDAAFVPSSICCKFQKFGVSCDDQECYQRVVEAYPLCGLRWDPDCNGLARQVCCELCRPSRCDNSFHVVRVPGDGEGVLVDGFVVEGGEASRQGATNVGGGIIGGRFTNLVIRNSTFRGNAGSLGAAVDIGGLVAENCIFEENLTFAGNSGVVRAGPDGAHPFNVERCVFRDNRSLAIDVIPWAGGFIRDSFFIANETGAVRVSMGLTVITDSAFFYNEGTAVEAQYGSSLALVNSILLGNEEPGNSPAGVATDGAAYVVNCLFANNRSGGGVSPYTGDTYAGFAAAIGVGLGIPWIENCTFVNNYAGKVGGVAAGEGAIIRNSMFWNNADSYGDGESAQLSGSTMASFDIRNTIIQGWTGMYSGVGNSGADPLFVDLLGPDGVAGTGDEDYRLSPDSPAINAGAITANTPETDLDGHARVLCGAVDLGPYEFGIGDYDCDRALTPADFPAWTWCMQGPALNPAPLSSGCEALDFTGDSHIDLSDFAALQRLVSR